MNILMLNYEFPPIGGGAGQAHYNILKQFAAFNDFHIDVLTCQSQPGYTEEPFASNITIHKVGIKKRSLQHWTKFEVLSWLHRSRPYYRQLIKKNNYQLAHAFFGFPTGYLTYGTAGQLPYLISLRGSDVPGNNPRFALDYKIMAPLFKRIWKNAAALTTPSAGLKDRALKFLPSSKIQIIPNGVDLKKFHPARENAATNSLDLLTVGRLSSSKRIDLLIAAMNIIAQISKNITLTIAGDGAQKSSLQQYIAESHLSHVVKLIGSVSADKMPELYRQHHLYVSATATEGMSNAMLEALASGLPVITTPAEGTAELIPDSDWFIHTPTPEAIAEKILGIIQDTKQIIGYRRAARSQAEKFNWYNTAKHYYNCYQDIIGNN